MSENLDFMIEYTIFLFAVCVLVGGGGGGGLYTVYLLIYSSM